MYAYVYGNDSTHRIHVCSEFWQAAQLGRDSKAGILVHEMSHFDDVADTVDHKYGVTNCLLLAYTDPAKAIENADNHEFFAEDP